MLPLRLRAKSYTSINNKTYNTTSIANVTNFSANNKNLLISKKNS